MNEEEIIQEIVDLVQDVNKNVVNVIASRLKEIGKLTEEEIGQLTALTRTQDLKLIEQEIARITELTPEMVTKLVEVSAKENYELAKAFYEAKGIEQAETIMTKTLKARAIKSINEDVLNLSKTCAFKIRGEVTSIRKAYTNAINRGIYEVAIGFTDYNTVIAGIVSDLAQSGLRTVDYGSGYSRRLDTSVRANIQDGIRQFNDEHRELQGKEYGADGYEISAHGLCRPEHQAYQGKQFTIKEFEKLNESLSTPIATGELNCKHKKFPIIMGVSSPTYTNAQLKELKDMANAKVTYTQLSGNKKTISRYDASQVQRNVETAIRAQKDLINALSELNETQALVKANERLTYLNKYYRKVSKEVGLQQRKDLL